MLDPDTLKAEYTDYSPPSIFDGTVSLDLYDSLKKLINEYGYTGVIDCVNEMSDGRLLTYMGVDAAKWAAQFKRLLPGTPEEGTMIGWFANAIEAGRSVGIKEYMDEK